MIRTTNILPAATANGASQAIMVKDENQCVFSLHTTGSTTATVNFVVGYGDVAPDFSAASTKTNDWHYASVVPVEDGTPIDGSTGVTTTTTDINAAYLLNVDIASWVGVVVSGYSAGVIDVLLTRTNSNFK